MCVHNVYNVYVHVYLIIYADGPLVTLFTEPKRVSDYFSQPAWFGTGRE